MKYQILAGIGATLAIQTNAHIDPFPSIDELRPFRQKTEWSVMRDLYYRNVPAGTAVNEIHLSTLIDPSVEISTEIQKLYMLNLDVEDCFEPVPFEFTYNDNKQEITASVNFKYIANKCFKDGDIVVFGAEIRTTSYNSDPILFNGKFLTSTSQANWKAISNVTFEQTAAAWSRNNFLWDKMYQSYTIVTNPPTMAPTPAPKELSCAYYSDSKMFTTLEDLRLSTEDMEFEKGEAISAVYSFPSEILKSAGTDQSTFYLRHYNLDVEECVDDIDFHEYKAYFQFNSLSPCFRHGDRTVSTLVLHDRHGDSCEFILPVQTTIDFSIRENNYAFSVIQYDEKKGSTPYIFSRKSYSNAVETIQKCWFDATPHFDSVETPVGSILINPRDFGAYAAFVMVEEGPGPYGRLNPIGGFSGGEQVEVRASKDIDGHAYVNIYKSPFIDCYDTDSVFLFQTRIAFNSSSTNRAILNTTGFHVL